MTAKELLTEAGLHESVWGKRIIDAEASGKFKPSNVKSASEWPTCACGRQDKRIPRSRSGAPHDWPLNQLGKQFYLEVRGNRFIPAAKCLIAIENRAAEILALLEPQP